MTSSDGTEPDAGTPAPASPRAPTGGPTLQKTPAKRAPAKRTGARAAGTRTTTAAAPVATPPATEAPASKKAPAKKSPAKKATATGTTAKKAPAKKAPAKRATTASAAKRAPAEKSPAKKAATKKAATKKVAATTSLVKTPVPTPVSAPALPVVHGVAQSRARSEARPVTTPAAAPTDAAAPVPATGTEGGRTTRLTRLARILVAIGLLACLVAAVVSVVQVVSVRTGEADGRAAVTSGRQAITAYTTYDYRTLGSDLGRVSALSTSGFRSQLRAARGKVAARIAKVQATSKPQVRSVGLQRRAGDKAVVIAAVDTRISNASSNQPVVREDRYAMTMDSSSGTWLLAGVEQVG